MPARILDGKSLAAQVRAEVKSKVAALAQRGIRPGLAVVLAGDDPASKVYVRNKTRACEEVGVRSQQIDYPAAVAQEELMACIRKLNLDPAVHGILVQLPLPPQLDAARVRRAVSPHKDVDGDHARALVYHTSHQVLADDPKTAKVLVGRYHNELRRTPDGWKISRLVLDLLWGEAKTDAAGYLDLVGGRGPGA